MELADIQGIVAYAYRQQPRAIYALLRIREGQAAAARAWLRDDALPLVGSSAARRREDVQAEATANTATLAIAFTHGGLAALGLAQDALDSFVPELRQGMTHPPRSRVLGDRDTDQWIWGGPGNRPHVLCAAFSAEAAVLQTWLAGLPAQVFETVHTVTAEMRPHVDAHGHLTNGFQEPFGFRDGIVQPTVQGLRPGMTTSPHNEVAPGEIVLGYPNQNHRTPASPWVRDADDPDGQLPEVAPGFRDLGRNGSFMVVRELDQDVGAFRQLHPSHQAKVIGRWPDGAPLALAPRANDDALATATDFGYYASDRAGLNCPLGAHVRRANPRDALADPERGSSPADAVASAKQHRLLRRARPYGPYPGSGREGLFFICLNTNIERQFEFVQQSWLGNPGFGGLCDEVDITLGRATRFTIPTAGRSERLSLGRYIRVRGGDYFFLPGLRALRYLAGR